MGYIEAIEEKGQEANPFFVMMGIEILSYEEGTTTLSMKIRPDMLNGSGWLQGGVYVALADEAMALALSTLLDENQEWIATTTESSSFLRGANTGTLHVTGNVVRRGRHTSFCEATVRLGGPTGKICTTTTAAFAVIRRT